MENKVADVPYIVHEADMARQERTIKRLWIALVIVSVLSLLLLTASWIGFMAYEAQFEDIEITQDNANGYNNYIGNDGDIYNGEADYQDP